MEEKLLYTGNSINVFQVCDILSQNQINYVKREQGADQYIGITMGNVMVNSEIYVNEEDFEKAKELIENFENCNSNKDDIDEDSEYLRIQAKKRSLIRSGFACFIIGVPIVVAIAIGIKYLVNMI